MTYLLLRFSTLGNVAMTVPVVSSLVRLQPSDRFVIVSSKGYNGMFYGMYNVLFHEVSFSLGLSAVSALYRQLSAYRPDAVIDLQSNLFTAALCALFRLHSTPVYVIRYGRWQKLLSIFRRGPVSSLPTEFERYSHTLLEAGLHTDTQFVSIPVNEKARNRINELYSPKKSRCIGIAPFAKHRSNILPAGTMKRIIGHFAHSEDTQVYLFGAGDIECEMLRQWSNIYPNTFSIAGKLALEEELELMRQLDVMICMDSANQHLSSLVGLRAVSVWLGTHPAIGFYGWKQRSGDCIQCQLPCRPCTIHGTRYCRYLNFACKDISAETIIERTEQVLSETKQAS